MKHRAQAYHFRFDEREDLALVGERGIDYEARQRLADQKLRHQAESDLNQLRIAEFGMRNETQPRTP